MSPEEQWDGPIQDAIREHDARLGHSPKARSAATSVSPVLFFAPPSRPTGGTVYVRPSDSGSPCARIDEAPPLPVVVVELPDFPGEER